MKYLSFHIFPTRFHCIPKRQKVDVVFCSVLSWLTHVCSVQAMSRFFYIMGFHAQFILDCFYNYEIGPVFKQRKRISFHFST